MKACLFALLLLPFTAANAHIPVPAGDNTERVTGMKYQITIYMVGDVCMVSGPNKTRIEIFDDQWNLLITETNCSPLTVPIDLGAYPDGDYNVKVTTTSGYVTDVVHKG